MSEIVDIHIFEVKYDFYFIELIEKMFISLVAVKSLIRGFPFDRHCRQMQEICNSDENFSKVVNLSLVKYTFFHFMR